MATVSQPDAEREAGPQRPPKPPREQIKPDEVLCQYCEAKCCRYFALPIDTPATRREFEYIRWYLLHERAAVFVEDGDWYLLVHSKCRHLRDDNLCSNYESRPPVCREYSTTKCEYEDDWVYDHYFETPEQVEEFAEAVLPPRKGRGMRSPKPDSLKVVR
jgi:Fe-S-cluster containining protein